jgi:hypothetical protein
MGGRRVLISHQWSGKTLADHRADNYTWVRDLLGITTATIPADDTNSASESDDQAATTTRYVWEKARPTDPDVMPLAARLLMAVSARIRRRNQLRQAQTAQSVDEQPEVS